MVLVNCRLSPGLKEVDLEALLRTESGSLAGKGTLMSSASKASFWSVPTHCLGQGRSQRSQSESLPQERGPAGRKGPCRRLVG